MNIKTLVKALTICIALNACNNTPQPCHIHGTMPSDKYNDKWIFLVPLQNPDSIGVDSIKIQGNQFDLYTNKFGMGTLRVDYRYRYGLQDLLVVTEPNCNVEVSIGANSKGGGTLQNDSLQVWKEKLEAYRQRISIISKNITIAKGKGNEQKVETLRAQADSLRDEWKNVSKQMAENLPDGALRDFLNTH